MSVKLLTENHLEFLSLKGGCAGSSESILVKMLHCWKSHDTAHFLIFIIAKLDQCKVLCSSGSMYLSRLFNLCM